MKSIQIYKNAPDGYDNAQKLPENFSDVEAFHKSMPEYRTTPLRRLSALAETLGVKEIYVKDESERFGLNAFKALGASYALDRIIKSHPGENYMFVSCTDGNHGKGLAWRAQALGAEVVIFMPKGSDARRVMAIEKYGAKVIVTDMNYDDTVRHAAAYAKARGAYLVQDTALPGYTDIPNDIMLGYSTMIREALEQMSEAPTHVFVQAGVGSMAGGVVWYLYHRYPDAMPFIGVIEAMDVACIYESVRQGRTVCIGGEPHTAMAGLNCGEANPCVFPLLKSEADCFIKCADAITFRGMARAKRPVGDDPSFSSGESGAVGLGLIETVLSEPDYAYEKALLGFDAESIILVFNTEGALENA
jgi:diaminopropionate ammonia-lyase